MFTMNGFRVRRASPDQDLAALESLESRAYGPAGTAVYDAAYFQAWAATNPEFLLLAENDKGEAVGYAYSQYVDVDFSNVGAVRSYDRMTDDGWTRASHRPDGPCLHVVNLASVDRGAGFVLSAASMLLGRRQGRKLVITLARMPGFDGYMKRLEADGHWPAACARLEDAAVGYALETVRLTNARIWPCMTQAPAALPPPAVPDPVIRKQLGFKGTGLAAVRQDFMNDPQSRDCAAILMGDLDEIAAALGIP